MKICPDSNRCKTKFKNDEGHCQPHKRTWLCDKSVRHCPICKEYIKPAQRKLPTFYFPPEAMAKKEEKF